LRIAARRQLPGCARCTVLSSAKRIRRALIMPKRAEDGPSGDVLVESGQSAAGGRPLPRRRKVELRATRSGPYAGAGRLAAAGAWTLAAH
jgi:hypothetical protein